METLQFLQGIKDGSISLEEGSEILKNLPYEDIGFAKLDHHRSVRNGFMEVIYGQGKTTAQLAQIFDRFQNRSRGVMATRCSTEQYGAVKEICPTAEFDPHARTIIKYDSDLIPFGNVAVCTGGTSDLPVAEEAALTAAFFGCKVSRFYDVGVAGIHRLFSSIEEIRKANCIIAVAGMEGALPGVLAGLVDVPVIAVPTSIGYGASFQGLAPLLTMLNSCAEGIAVVNIDNGFGAGYMAAQINKLAEGKR